MRKLFNLVLVICVIVVLTFPGGIVSAATIVDLREGKLTDHWPGSDFLGNTDVTYIAADYGAYMGTGPDGKGIYIYDPEAGASMFAVHGMSGLLILAENQALVDMYKAGNMPATLADLLTNYPCCVSDIVEFYSGTSSVILWSDPFTILLRSWKNPIDSIQASIFTVASDMYAANNMTVILESTGTPTIYVPAADQPGYLAPGNVYDISSYEYHIYSDPRDDNGCDQVPEPVTLLLLGFGLLGLAGVTVHRKT